MNDLVTVTGFVGNDPRCNLTEAGLAITNFRLASTRRYFDRVKGEWVDGETNWYSVGAFRQLAVNAAASISKGDRVVVHGRLRVRPWGTGEKSGTAVEIDADAIGHDLSWGRTTVTRTAPARATDGDERTSAAATDANEPADAAAGEWSAPGASHAWPGEDRVAASGAATATDDADQPLASPESRPAGAVEAVAG